jgi:hypothetical protein
MMTKSAALSAYLAQPQPAFDWQHNNCCHFAARYVVQIEPGTNPLAGISMASSRATTRRLLRAAGGLAALVTQALQRTPLLPSYAQLGDLVLLNLPDANPQAQALALCCGDCAAALDPTGTIAYVPMTQALHAWRLAA